MKKERCKTEHGITLLELETKGTYVHELTISTSTSGRMLLTQGPGFLRERNWDSGVKNNLIPWSSNNTHRALNLLLHYRWGN